MWVPASQTAAKKHECVLYFAKDAGGAFTSVEALCSCGAGQAACHHAPAAMDVIGTLPERWELIQAEEDSARTSTSTSILQSWTKGSSDGPCPPATTPMHEVGLGAVEYGDESPDSARAGTQAGVQPFKA